MSCGDLNTKNDRVSHGLVDNEMETKELMELMETKELMTSHVSMLLIEMEKINVIRSNEKESSYPFELNVMDWLSHFPNILKR